MTIGRKRMQTLRNRTWRGPYYGELDEMRKEIGAKRVQARLERQGCEDLGQHSDPHVHFCTDLESSIQLTGVKRATALYYANNRGALPLIITLRLYNAIIHRSNPLQNSTRLVA